MLIRFFVVLLSVAFLAGNAFSALDSGKQSAHRDTLFEVVNARTYDEATLDKELGDQDDRVWLDGDVLWVAKRSSKGPWSIIGSMSHPLTQVDDSDIWAIGLRCDRWAEAFIRIAFIGTAFPTNDIEYTTWRGDRAPAPARQAEPGLVESLQLPGPIEGTERTITIVLPPHYETQESIPAIVLADGQSAEEWGKVIAALCLDGKARPVAIIGVHSAAYQGDRSKPYDPQLDLRAREYLDGYDSEQFAIHLNWVIDVVLPEIARRYPISIEPENLAVAGFSNGGAFAACAALRRGDVFSMSLALSIGIPADVETYPTPPKARFFLAAGVLEQQFLNHTTMTRDRIQAADGETTMMSFVAGHDPEMWTLAASMFVPEMFARHKETRMQMYLIDDPSS